MTVRVGVAVSHRIRDQHHIVTVVVTAARSRFHAEAGGDAGNEDLSYATLAQVPPCGGYLACFFVNRTLNIVLMAMMPAKKKTSAESSPLETFPIRNRM